MTCEDNESKEISDIDGQKILININSHLTIRQIAEITNILYTKNGCKLIGHYVSSYYICVPHYLIEKNLINPISICDILRKHKKKTFYF